MQYLQTKVFLGKNQYTSNVESGSTRTELKHWFFTWCQDNSYEYSWTSGKGLKNGTYYGTYNALQMYDHYASFGLFYSTS